jgi:class 3 adenylate cyclase
LVYDADRKQFDDQKHLTSNTARPHFQAGFEFRYKHAAKKIATEIKILCAKLRAAKGGGVQNATQAKSFVQWAGDDRLTLAIVFTDIVGSVAIAESIKDERMNDVRRAHFTKCRKLIAQFTGHEIKTIGDSFMVAFRSVEKAFDFAQALKTNTGHPQVQIRAGIHIGPMRVEEGDVFGDTVNIAARVAGVIEGAEIWLSNRAKEDIDSLGASHHSTLKWERNDEIALKGFQGAFTLWSLA